MEPGSRAFGAVSRSPSPSPSRVSEFFYFPLFCAALLFALFLYLWIFIGAAVSCRMKGQGGEGARERRVKTQMIY